MSSITALLYAVYLKPHNIAKVELKPSRCTIASKHEFSSQVGGGGCYKCILSPLNGTLHTRSRGFGSSLVGRLGDPSG
jgi:hypothetical protein